MSVSQLDILYEEGPCLVLSKPSGLLTQAPLTIDSLERRVRDFYKTREGKEGNIYLGVPHRLDRPVSGVIVFGRHVRAASRIAAQFAKRTVRKVYWACVSGEVIPAEGEWRDYLKKVPDEPQALVTTSEDPEGREAVLRYRTLGRHAYGSWLEIELLTGRMHQIRIQAGSRGHAILGDLQYGSALPFGEPFEDVRLRAIALHARRLEFLHPMTREPLAISAPLPATWEALKLPIPTP